MNKINSKNEITNRKNKFTLLDNNEDESYYDETMHQKKQRKKKLNIQIQN